LKRAGHDADSDLDARQVLRNASGRTAELVNLETRRGKEEYSRDELFPVWQEIARWVGIKEGHVEQLRHSPRPFTESQEFLAKEDLFRQSLAKLSEEFSHFSEKDLVRRVAEEAQGRGINAKDVRELIEYKIGIEEVLRLGELVTGRKNQERNSYRERSEARYTTEEILKMEGLMLGSTLRMAQKSAAIDPMIAEVAIASKKQLAEEQKNAVRHLTSADGSQIACMTGKAGTGKSTTLGTCRLAWEMAGHKVIGCALAGVAADELRRSSGIESDTLTRTLMRLEYGRLTLTPNHIVVLDEAGMVATKPMAALVRHVEEAGAKLVLVGDAAQLQAIGAGGPFRSITERVGQCELTQIRRQREEWRRQTVEHFSRGDARQALTAYAARQQLHVTETREEAIRGLVERWKADNGIQTPHDVLLLASLNAEVRAINRQCQEERLRAGELHEEKLSVGGDNIHEHDRVLLTKRDRKLGVENGFMGEVVSIDHEKAALLVRLDQNGRAVSLCVEDYGAKNIRLGYASTVHKSQGRTVEHCHVLMGGHMTDLHLGYVQASRCRESTHLFIDQTHAGPHLREAIRALSRDRTKDLATDILDRCQTRALEQEEALQQQRRHRL
jgi:Ti-type conjugative transfer relaxase TraA